MSSDCRSYAETCGWENAYANVWKRGAVPRSASCPEQPPSMCRRLPESGSSFDLLRATPETQKERGGGSEREKGRGLRDCLKREVVESEQRQRLANQLPTGAGR